MAWWEGRMLSFDLETTAPDPEDARIVSWALAWVGGGEPTIGKSGIVNPGVEIPQEAIDVHGITNERARAEGEDLASVVPWLADLLLAYLDLPLVIFNARYDLTVLDRELRRLGAPAGLYGFGAVFDPIVCEKHLDRYRPKRVASHSLEDCCRVWKVKLDGAHDATFDAIAAARLTYRLGKDGRVIRRARDEDEREELIGLTREWERVRHDLDALQEWQQRIAAEEAERLEAYFHAGDPRKDVPPQPDRLCPRDWPLIPVDWRDSHPQ